MLAVNSGSAWTTLTDGFSPPSTAAVRTRASRLLPAPCPGRESMVRYGSWPGSWARPWTESGVVPGCAARP